MKLSRTASVSIILGGLAVIYLFLFLGVAWGGFGFQLEMNEILASTWKVTAPWEILIWLAITSFGAWYVLLGLVAIWCIIFWQTERRFQAGLLIGSFVAVESLALILKDAFMVARPVGALVETIGSGFPSGHTATVVVVFGLFAIFANAAALRRSDKRYIALLSFLTIIGVGLSRVTLGAHYPNDVLGGLLLGGVVFFSAYLLYILRRILGVKKVPQPPKDLVLKGVMVSLLVIFIGVAIEFVQFAI